MNVIEELLTLILAGFVFWVMVLAFAGYFG